MVFGDVSKQATRVTLFSFPRSSKAASDVKLLRAYAAGDSAAFDELYSRHKEGLFNFISRSLAQPAAAEEITQDVWMAVIDKAAEFEPGAAAFRTWLYRIASNKVADFYRRKVNQRTDELDTTNEQFSANQLDSEDRVLFHQLLAALAELPEEQRVTFVLQQEGFTYTEIAQITGVGNETVKSRLRYARSATQDRMELKA